MTAGKLLVYVAYRHQARLRACPRVDWVLVATCTRGRYEKFKAGASVKDIARQKEVKEQTIVGYLGDAVLSGYVHTPHFLAALAHRRAERHRSRS